MYNPWNAGRSTAWTPPRPRRGAPGQPTGIMGLFGLPAPRQTNLAAVPGQIYTPGDIRRTQGQATNRIAAGASDAIANLKSALAGTGAAGSLAEKSTQLSEQAGIQGASAAADAELTARKENAAQALAKGGLEASVQGMEQSYGLGLGNLQLGKNAQDLQKFLETRGQDINLTQSREGNTLQQWLGETQAKTSERGQDVDLAKADLAAKLGIRAQDVDTYLGELQNALGMRQTDVSARGQELDYQQGTRGQDLEAGTARDQQSLQAMIAQLNAQLTGRGQDVTQRADELNYNLGARGQDVTGRGQTLDYTLGGRGQDIGANQDALSALAAALGIGSGERGQDVRYQGDVYQTQNQDTWKTLQMLMSLLGMMPGQQTLTPAGQKR